MESWVWVIREHVASCAHRIVVNAASLRLERLSHPASTGHLPFQKSRPARRKPPAHPEAVPDCRVHAGGDRSEAADATPTASPPNEPDRFRQDCWPRELTASAERPWSQDCQVIADRDHRTLKTRPVKASTAGRAARSCVHPCLRTSRDLWRRAGGRGLLMRSAPHPRLLGLDGCKINTRPARVLATCAASPKSNPPPPRAGRTSPRCLPTRSAARLTAR